MSKQDEQLKEEQQFNGTLKDLVKVRRHLINLLIMTFMWCVSSFSMYLVTFTSKYIPGNIFDNIFTSSILDIPFGILGGIAYHKLGPKVSLVLAFGTGIIGSVSILFLGEAH